MRQLRYSVCRGLLGIVIAIGFHIKSGWWLDAPDRVREMLIVLGIAAVVVGLWGERETPAYLRVLALWAGFQTGVALVLFSIGPGNLFPIVLGIAGALSLCAVLAGPLIGTVRDQFGH